MARRKPNVSARTRPSEALKGLPPRMTPEGPDFLNAPASSEAARGREPTLTAAEAAYGGVVEPEEDLVAENGLPDADGGTADEQPGAADPPPEPEEEPVLGEMMSDRILHNVFQTPVIPDGLMSDEPFPGQTPDEGDRVLAQHVPQTPQQAAAANALADPGYAPVAVPAAVHPLAAPAPRQDTHHLPGGHDRAGGIAGGAGDPRGVPDVGMVTTPVVDPSRPQAQPASGSTKYVQRVTVAEAYQFTGRVQTAPPWIDRNWLSFDEASKDQTGVGIVLELPGIGICRIGDYIVQQKVMMDETGFSLDRVAVYSRDDFEKMFLRVGT